MPTVYKTFVRRHGIRDGFTPDSAFIKPIEVDRVTHQSVFIGDRRAAKFSDWTQYHDTWQEAYSFVLQEAKRRHDDCKKELESRFSDLAALVAMKA